MLNDNREVPVDEILDSRGYSLLHEATFQDSTKLVRVLIRHGRLTLTPPKLSDWIDAKTHNDGFSALHFASFKGNPDSCELLIDNGADIYARNNFGINMVHVAAQGDQPISLYFFKLRGLDLRSKDDRGSTPLHWACYSKAEIALVYLLSWVKHLEDRDCDGFTPLHLAVKSVEGLRSTRPVRSLLIRGASRDAADNQGRKPIDFCETFTNDGLKNQLIGDLKPPKDISCLMMKTPLKLVEKSYKTPLFMWTLFASVEWFLMAVLFPLWYRMDFLICLQITLFLAALVFHMICLCRDPGTLKSPKGVPFMSMMRIFDPVLLCPDCEVVRTDRSRHCSICNVCIERFDHHCPWINNCVGLSNHLFFMLFLVSTICVLATTFFGIILNFNCYENFDLPRTRENFLFVDTWLPDDAYGKGFVLLSTWFCLLVSGIFMGLVTLLTSVQARNFCLNLTTSERFSGKGKPQQDNRTSSYLSANNESGEESLMGESIIEAMQTRDHSDAKCPWILNCYDMGCLSEHPDQLKIYDIQKQKHFPDDGEAGDTSRASISKLRSSKAGTPSRRGTRHTGASKAGRASVVAPEAGHDEM